MVVVTTHKYQNVNRGKLNFLAKMMQIQIERISNEYRTWYKDGTKQVRIISYKSLNIILLQHGILR